jgi:parallel beta-helix repeat protein
VTIANCVASGFVNSFKLQGVTDSALIGNTATANEGNGFYAADGSAENVFRGNTASAEEVRVDARPMTRTPFRTSSAVHDLAGGGTCTSVFLFKVSATSSNESVGSKA